MSDQAAMVSILLIGAIAIILVWILAKPKPNDGHVHLWEVKEKWQWNNNPTTKMTIKLKCNKCGIEDYKDVAR